MVGGGASELSDAVPSLGRSVGRALGAFTDDVARFVLLNLVVGSVGLVAALIAQLHVALVVALVMLVPPTMALARAADDTVRGAPARLGRARAGATHRAPTSLLLGSAQLLVMLVGLVALQVGLAASSLLVVAVGVLAAWVVVIVAALAVAVWPLLLDPQRDDVPTSALWRLGLAVLATRPWRVLVLVALLALITFITVRTIVGTLLLPAIGLLVVAHAVLPVADEIEQRVG